MQDHSLDALKQTAKTLLANFPFPTQDPERFMDAYWEQNLATVIIASDGLTLDHKIALEKHFHAQQALSSDQEWHLYFKRRNPAPPSGAFPPPGAVNPKRPYGIRGNQKPIPGVKQIIAVASGKGGVGKSTVSAQLACTLAWQGKRVGLLDADVYGPSAPTMLGLAGSMEVNGKNQLIPMENHGVKCVSFGFLTTKEQPVMWRGPLVSRSLEQFCFDVDWGDLDILVIDFPPGTGDISLSLLELLPISAALVVTTPQDIALMDAHKAITLFQTMKIPVLGLVENMATYHCPSCGHEEDLFGKEALEAFTQDIQIPIIGRIPLNAGVRKACDQGNPLIFSDQPHQAQIWANLANKCTEKLYDFR